MAFERRARTRRAALFAGAVAALAAAALGSLPREPALLIRDGRGRAAAEIRLEDGRFSHVFLHSFHLTPVEERFVIERAGPFRARLRLYELRYRSSGVGMPEDAEGGYRLEEGYFVLSMDRSFDSIPVLVSIVPGHGIVAGDIYSPFRNWAGPEEGLRLSARMVLAPLFPRR
ncbi:MAG TPA: DUF1850 domain-containing protein [Spirochaetia bacterium]|nr:DUF1850 domain-containing protein [Spirochaetia bacterium]HRZ66257.1 DUF1850 domain-containing protein [Spirochaetia bacterium]